MVTWGKGEFIPGVYKRAIILSTQFMKNPLSWVLLSIFALKWKNIKDALNCSTLWPKRSHMFCKTKSSRSNIGQGWRTFWKVDPTNKHNYKKYFLDSLSLQNNSISIKLVPRPSVRFLSMTKLKLLQTKKKSVAKGGSK